MELKEPVFEILAQPVSDEGLAWPTITIDKPAATHGDCKPGEQNVWDYLIEHVEEFEVAKAITDFVEANPKAITDRNTPVDLMGLHLLAKVSQKRSAVRFAKEQAAQAQAAEAVRKAREQSRSLRSGVRNAVAHVRSALAVLRDNPHLATMGVVAAWAAHTWMR